MVNFPKYITRFAKLWILKFVNCKQFGEKVGLPRNIVCAMKCRSFPAMAFCVTLEVEFKSYGENGKFDCSIYSSINGCKRQHANYRLLLDSSTIMLFHYIRFIDSSMKLLLDVKFQITIAK